MPTSKYLAGESGRVGDAKWWDAQRKYVEFVEAIFNMAFANS